MANGPLRLGRQQGAGRSAVRSVAVEPVRAAFSRLQPPSPSSASRWRPPSPGRRDSARSSPDDCAEPHGCRRAGRPAVRWRREAASMSRRRTRPVAAYGASTVRRYAWLVGARPPVIRWRISNASRPHGGRPAALRGAAALSVPASGSAHRITTTGHDEDADAEATTAVTGRLGDAEGRGRQRRLSAARGKPGWHRSRIAPHCVDTVPGARRRRVGLLSVLPRPHREVVGVPVLICSG